VPIIHPAGPALRRRPRLTSNVRRRRTRPVRCERKVRLPARTKQPRRGCFNPEATKATFTDHGSSRWAGASSQRNGANHGPATLPGVKPKTWRRDLGTMLWSQRPRLGAQNSTPRATGQPPSQGVAVDPYSVTTLPPGLRLTFAQEAQALVPNQLPWQWCALVKPVVLGTQTSSPNPSVEARPNGKPPNPPPGFAYHPSGGFGALPSAPPHLER
jgi:hypothetical protein